MLVVDPQTQLVKVAILALTIFTVLISMDRHFTEHVGEYLSLILLGTVGMMFLVSAGGSADGVHFAGTDQPLALHPDGV